MKKKIICLIALVFACSMMLAACGDSDFRAAAGKKYGNSNDD